ncbi:hypothetical protein, partial [Streptomyces acidiscabies]|uniref:hypothetical protein n=2 Tax=Bacteria TaxID=2 RepID=UPI0038F7735C
MIEVISKICIVKLTSLNHAKNVEHHLFQRVQEQFIVQMSVKTQVKLVNCASSPFSLKETLL